MQMTNIISTPEAEKGFYPTPAALVDKLINGEELLKVRTILEPSAGKGNIIGRLAEIGLHELEEYPRSRWDNFGFSVDCVEIDPYLRSILKYEYGGQREDEIRQRLSVLQDKQKYNYHTRTSGELTPEEKAEENHLNKMQKGITR